jgi:hypothetical protein
VIGIFRLFVFAGSVVLFAWLAGYLLTRSHPTAAMVVRTAGRNALYGLCVICFLLLLLSLGGYVHAD